MSTSGTTSGSQQPGAAVAAPANALPAACAENSGAGTATGALPVVRISKASFDPDDYERVNRALDEVQSSLIPAIRRLGGLLHFYAGIDRESGTMINVSVWTSLEAAEQMNGLREMQVAGETFVRMGARFDRPIVNYGSIWMI